MYTKAMARRPRDPEGRRRAILKAAAELMMEVGVGAVTHRKVAERAQVPLGSTTQYFTSLAELLGEAMVSRAEEQQAEVDQWAVELEETDDVAAFLAAAAVAYRPAPAAARAELAFVVAIFDKPQYRRLVMPVDDIVTDYLTRHYSPYVARTVSTFLHGFWVQSAFEGIGVDQEELEHTLRALLATAPPQTARRDT